MEDCGIGHFLVACALASSLGFCTAEACDAPMDLYAHGVTCEEAQAFTAEALAREDSLRSEALAYVERAHVVRGGSRDPYFTPSRTVVREPHDPHMLTDEELAPLDNGTLVASTHRAPASQAWLASWVGVDHSVEGACRRAIVRAGMTWTMEELMPPCVSRGKVGGPKYVCSRYGCR